MQVNLTNKTRNELLQLSEKVDILKNKRKYRFLDFVFPAEGKYSQTAYPKAMEFFAAGYKYRFRCLTGGNGSGKSFNVYTEGTYHWTGEYPSWWVGKIQKNPHHWWIIVESADTWKASGQLLLLGTGTKQGDEGFGTGLIPKDSIINTESWSGVSGAVKTIFVRNKKTGEQVIIEVKTSEQKRENLQAATLDGCIWDEEPPSDIYEETVFRLRGSPIKEPGIGMLALTSLKGPTDFILQWAPNCIWPKGEHPDDKTKYVVCIKASEVPHLSEEDREMYRKNSSANLLLSRTEGLIALGSGRIYPYPENQVFVKPFQIPDYWPRCFALDFGHHVTCVLWGAKDPNTHILYIYAEYYSEGHQTAQVHSLNIRQRGIWIKGICDPSGGGRQDDGRQLVDLFRSHGLDLTYGENSLTGITRNCDMFENGTLKIFESCLKTKEEYRLYRFDSKNPNEPARNQKDHAMDCMKYLTSKFDWVASTEYDEEYSDGYSKPNRGNFDPLTGY